MTISDTYFQAFYDELTEGQKQHMTNKIYKETGMYPQKLKHDVIYPSGSVFTHRQTGASYVLTVINVDMGTRWVAVNLNTGLGYTAAKELGVVTNDNLKEILVHPEQFVREK